MSLIPLIAWVLTVFIWSFVFGRNRHDPINRSFLALAGTSILWLSFELLFYVPVFYGEEIFLLHLIMPCWIAIGFLFMNFAYRLCERPKDWIYWLFLLIFIGGVTFDLLTDSVLLGFERRDWGVIDLRNSLNHSLLSLIPSVTSMWGLWLVNKKWNKTTDREQKAPLSLILWGGVFTLLIVSMVSIILPNVFGLMDFPRFGSSAMALFNLVIFIAVIRYDFLTVTIEKVAEDFFEDVHDGLVLVDLSGRVIRMNGAAGAMLGLDSRSAAGRRASDFFLSYNSASDFQNQKVAIEIDGELRTLIFSQSAVKNKEDIAGRILIIRDVTDKTRADAVLRRTRDQLEAEVHARTMELRKTQESEEMGTLAGSIAHDFNNLLAAIMGFATAASDDLPLEHPVRADFSEILNASRRARDIVRQLLNFSREEKPERKVFDVAKVLSDTIMLLEASLPAAIVVRRHFTDESCCATIDHSQIHQVFMNLSTNAFQSIRGKGEIRFDIDVVDCDESSLVKGEMLSNGRYVRVSISDTGHGIRPHVLEKIFEPFFSTRELGKATGLGLATALRILRNHDGAIDVESEYNEGSTFHVYFPWVDPDEGMEPEESQKMFLGNGEVIALIDDKIQVVRVGKRLLESLGYVVKDYSNPLKALESFRREPQGFDLIITDQSMPDMTGVELAVEVLKFRNDVPIILVSGNATLEEQRRARDLGISEFIHKPLSKAVLAKAVRQHLDRRK